MSCLLAAACLFVSSPSPAHLPALFCTLLCSSPSLVHSFFKARQAAVRREPSSSSPSSIHRTARVVCSAGQPKERSSARSFVHCPVPMLMGFPVGNSEMPKLVLHLLFLLGHLRRLSSWLLRLAGADPDDADHHHPRHPSSAAAAAAAQRLEEHSPAVRFDSLSTAAVSSSSSSSGGGSESGGEATAPRPRPLLEGCCVCLGDFHAAAEVRRARGCRHVFHRACLDRWAAHGHRTCPLCRTPLLPPLLLPLPLPLPLPPS